MQNFFAHPHLKLAFMMSPNAKFRIYLKEKACEQVIQIRPREFKFIS
jgi:hypothetical protein